MTEPNPAQLEIDVIEARHQFMDAVIVLGNLRANEITNENPSLMASLRQQMMIAESDASEAEVALMQAVRARAEGRPPKPVAGPRRPSSMLIPRVGDAP